MSTMDAPTELLGAALLALDAMHDANSPVAAELARLEAIKALRDLAEHIFAGNAPPYVAEAIRYWQDETGYNEPEGY